MHKAQQQSRPNLRRDVFEAEMVEVAQFYNLQVAQGQAKGYVPSESSSFHCGSVLTLQMFNIRSALNVRLTQLNADPATPGNSTHVTTINPVLALVNNRSAIWGSRSRSDQPLKTAIGYGRYLKKESLPTRGDP